jgi:hypothetical protein
MARMRRHSISDDIFSGRRKMFHSKYWYKVSAVILIVCASMFAVANLAAPRSIVQAATVSTRPASPEAVSFSETFMTNTASGWTLLGNALLTSGAGDAVGDGWLRLTANSVSLSGTAVYNTAFSSSGKFVAQFQYATYGGTGADGLAVYFLDGATASPTQGSAGGSLGYSRSVSPSIPGVTNGYVGVGFDEFGNFSTAVGDCAPSCPGQNANSITIRGSGNLTTGFNYLTRTSQTIETGGRTLSNTVRVVFDNNKLSVWVDAGSTGNFVNKISNLDLSTAISQTALPATFKLGFSGSTGGQRNYHEVRNVSVRTGVTHTLTSSVSSAVYAQSVTFTATVSAPSTPIGTVTFRDNGVPLCSNVALNGSGQATCTTTALAATNHSISGEYSGDSNFAGATSNSVNVLVYFDCTGVTTVTTNTTDGATGSLRKAIYCAAPNATITFSPTLASQLITLTSGEILITKTLTIDGSGAPGVGINGNNASRALSVTAPISIISLTFQKGNTTGKGGGIASTSPLTLTSVKVLTNTASEGGGVYVSSALIVNSSQFISNTAVLNSGGALRVFASASTVKIDNSLFANNSSGSNGGAADLDATANVSGTQFLSNTASSNAGAVYFNKNAKLENSLFRNNSAASYAGGAYAEAITSITNTQFINNAAYYGGGMYFNILSKGRVVNSLFARNSANTGSAFRTFSTYAINVIHTTIASPTLASGSAIYTWNGTVNLTNTIIASYTTGILNSSATANEWNTLYDNVPTPRSGTVASNGALTGPAAFVNPAQDNYHLSTASLAINNGVTPTPNLTFDIDGDARPQSTGYDVGYDETAYSSAHVITPTAGANGSITPGILQVIADGGSITFTITPNSNSVIADVKVDGISQGPIGSYPFLNVTANHVITASFTCESGSTVQNTSNSGSGSLRSVIDCALPYDTIGFNPSLANQTVLLTTGEISINKALTIDGSAASGVRVSGNNASRVFSVTAPLSIMSVTIQNGNVTGNGGGLNTTSPLTLTNVKLLTNTASNQGGGVYANSTVNLIGTQFISNTTITGTGGGLRIYATGSVAKIEGGLFANNSSGANGGAGDLDTIAYVSGTQFLSNTAASNAGAVYFNRDAKIENSLFRNNRAAGYAGGAYAEAITNITNTQFINNYANNGGGIYFDILSKGWVVNSLFARNSAFSSGSAFRTFSAYEIDVIHTTIASPTLASGSAIYVWNGTVNLTNTIIASYTIGIQNPSDTANEWNTLYYGVPTPRSGSVGSTGAFTGSPAFVNPIQDNYHLTSASLAINNGVTPTPNVATDIDGDARPQSAGYDIGYDETPYSSPYIITPSAGPNGSINPGTAQGVVSGGSLTFTITPDPGSSISDVAVDSVSKGAISTYVFTNVVANHTITAAFACESIGTTVSNNSDSGSGSLRSVIRCASAGATITFNPSLANQLITLTGGEIAISKTLTINGSAATNVRVSGNSASRIFNLTAPINLSSLIIQNGTVTGDGGGIYATSPLTLTNVKILTSTASHQGGGLYTTNGLNLNNVQFTANTASGSSGGALRVYAPSSIVKMVGGLFANNTANFNSGAADLDAIASISGTQFLSNTAQNGNGGAMWLNQTAIVENSLFKNNVSSGAGGGFYAVGVLGVTNTQFINNRSQFQYGGGLSLSGSSGRIVNSVFARNSASSGAALRLNSGNIQIIHTTVSSPTLGSGSAIQINGGTIGITNTIIAHYATGLANSGTVYENYNLFFGNTTPKSGTIDGGGADVSGAPGFVNETADNYHLTIGAAIDRGTDAGISIDFDGAARPVNGAFDIGAYEYQGAVLHVYLPLALKNF